ncbi:MAG: thiol oxidoreductase [Alteromonadaceae bacterium]|nr:MAG: thiol oxidoreductase [Alteromonadaceae bacterium]
MRPVYLSLTLLSVLLSACGGGGGSSSSGSATSQTPTPTQTPALGIEHLSAGDTTVVDNGPDAFGTRSANLTDVDGILKFNLGNDFFENPWVAGSASTSSRDGLGGLFNNNACQDCHVRDGRGRAPNVSATEDGTDFSSLLIRASRTLVSADQSEQLDALRIANVPDSSVGGQLQHESVIGVSKEASLRVSYTSETIMFNDGSSLELRKPQWHLTSEYAGSGHDFDQDTVFSARVAPPMIGLGLLELIPEADLLLNEDVDDANQDGISGKANRVWSIEAQGTTIGRFGWKAGQPSLLEQGAGAFVNDMGLTSRLHLNESCLAHQADCLNTENGNGDSVEEYDYEVSDTILEAITFYSSHLAVPQRRNAFSDQVQQGKTLFQQASCDSCHVARFTTGQSTDLPELSEQIIFPYTDLLLHDMGEGLADFTVDNVAASGADKVEFLATAREWRTPPLWGLGLTKTVNPEATFLHDGRARTILEAVLWHGGEAEDAKQQVLAMSAGERDALLAFLNDL